MAGKPSAGDGDLCQTVLPEVNKLYKLDKEGKKNEKMIYVYICDFKFCIFCSDY